MHVLATGFVSPQTERLVALLQESLDHNFNNIAIAVENSADLKAAVQALLDAPGPPPTPDPEGPKIKYELHGHTFYIPEELVKDILAQNVDAIAPALFHLAPEISSEYLLVLRMSGTIFGDAVEVIRDPDGLYRYFGGGIELGADEYIRPLAEQLLNAAQNERLSEQSFRPHPLGGDLSGSTSTVDLIDGTTIVEDHLIDFSKGECQYISARQSEMLNPGAPWHEGMDLTMRVHCEMNMRDYTPRQLIDLLRRVGHDTQPTSRSGYHLRDYKPLGITVLFYRNRALTFAWTRKLPKGMRKHSPIHTRKKAGVDRLTGLRTNQNYYSVLGPTSPT